jgi:hypothetical protein
VNGNREFTIESLENTSMAQDPRTTWINKQNEFDTQLTEYARNNLNTMTIEQLQNLRGAYEEQRVKLSNYLKNAASTYNLSAKLQHIGEIQGQIRGLENQNETMETDVDTALARDELLRSKDTTGNSHTVYILDRPIRRGMVPYLWVLSVLFVGIGLLFFYWLTPLILVPQTNNAYGSPSGSVLQIVTDIFTNRLTWISLFAAACIVILFLSLKIAGVFGK